jgi:O-antigen/teichoic acid export membrane protein
MVFRNLAKDTLIYGGADFFTKVIAFIAFPLIAAALSPKAFGTMELIVTATTILGLLMGCGLNNSVQRYYWDKGTSILERPIVVSSGLITQAVFGFVVLILGLLILPFILPIVQQAELPLTWVALVAALLLMVFSQLQQYLLDVTRLHFSPWKFLIISMLSRVSGMLLAVVAVVYLKWGIDGLFAVQACVALLILPIAIWMVKKDITLSIDKKWVQELVGFGYPFIFAGIAYWLFGSIDRWMLAAMSSIEEVGIYSVSFRFASIVFFVSMAFGQAWSPVAIKIRTDHPDIYRNIYAKVLLILLYVMLVIGGGVALFSGELIGLIMPVEYASSAMPLIVLCIGVILQATQQITAIGISLEKKSFLFARLAWLTAIINATLNWFLIPSFGATGAAWATSISYLVLIVSYMIYTQKLHTLPIDWFKLAIMLLLGTVVFLAAILMHQSTFSVNILITKTVIAVACLIIGWVILPKRSV